MTTSAGVNMEGYSDWGSHIVILFMLHCVMSEFPSPVPLLKKVVSYQSH
jgi:hypothetical protein